MHEWRVSDGSSRGLPLSPPSLPRSSPFVQKRMGRGRRVRGGGYSWWWKWNERDFLSHPPLKYQEHKKWASDVPADVRYGASYINWNSNIKVSVSACLCSRRGGASVWSPFLCTNATFIRHGFRTHFQLETQNGRLSLLLLFLFLFFFSLRPRLPSYLNQWSSLFTTWPNSKVPFPPLWL